MKIAQLLKHLKLNVLNMKQNKNKKTFAIEKQDKHAINITKYMGVISYQSWPRYS
jgi:hypothetical protein